MIAQEITSFMIASGLVSFMVFARLKGRKTERRRQLLAWGSSAPTDLKAIVTSKTITVKRMDGQNGEPLILVGGKDLKTAIAIKITAEGFDPVLVHPSQMP